MKKVEVIIYMGLQEHFEKVLKEEGIEEYIIVPKVLGKLKGSNPKTDTHTWPGYYLLYRFCVPNEQYEGFRERLYGLEDDWEKEGFMATIWEIDERCGGGS